MSGTAVATNATHTPGPWHISQDKHTIFAAENGPGVLIRGIEQTIPQIAYIPSNGFAASLDEQKANAHLIAAAPDMLSALKRMPRECPIVTHHKPDCDWCAILRAIAKAEGRQ